MSNDNKIAIYGILGTLLAALATCVIAFLNCQQLKTMESTLNVLLQTTRFEQRPRIGLYLNETGERSNAKSFVIKTEVGGDRIYLNYYVINKGIHPAYKFKYHHELRKIRNMVFPILDSMQTMHEYKTLWPSDFWSCGADNILEQNLIDSLKSDTLYRHLFISYEDENGNKYKQKAVWQIMDYKKGDDKIEFTTLEDRLLSLEN